jgi:hypothetical protein
MTIGHRRIEAIAKGQRGSFSRSQAHASGLSDRQLRRRVQSGVLQQVGPHAFRIWGASRTPLVDLTSLLLDIGEPCAASGPTAAGLHGFDGFALAPPFHVTVPRDRNVRRIGSIVHTTSQFGPLERTVVGGLACTSPCRTIIDLARCCSVAALARAIDSAIRDRLASEEQLHRRIAALRGHGRHGIPALLDVLNGNEVTRGAHSWLEREFLRLVASAGLPRPATQQVLTRAGDRMVRVDCRFPGTNVVVELLGYHFHRTRDQLRRDAERANALMLEGFAPYQFAYDHVVHEPANVLTTITRALQASL